MENIDNSFFRWETSNGTIIKQIKDSLEKELSIKQNCLVLLQRIKEVVYHVAFNWQNFLRTALYTMNCHTECDNKYDYTLRTDFFTELMRDARTIVDVDWEYRHSPIETLYLKTLQHEQLGQVKDILFVNNIKTNNNYCVPPKLFDELRALHKNIINIDEVKVYIEKNAYNLEKYVYFDREPHKEQRRRIRKSDDKVIMVWNFCTHTRFDIDVGNELTELWIVSCLQAILMDSSNEIFDYTFHAYQEQSTSKSAVQGALKNKHRTYDALQTYWNRKVDERWYANIGKHDLRMRFIEIEGVCDEIMTKIFSHSNIDDMSETHNQYFEGAELFLELCSPEHTDSINEILAKFAEK
jgi:hypothetical protein